MTPEQIEKEKSRAAILAISVGGILAVLLGLTADGAVVWDPGKARFITGGRYVTLDTIRGELRRFEGSVAARMAKLADALGSGSIDLAAWQTRMKELIGSSHIVMAALAAGSIGAAAENADVQEAIVSERKYVDKFAGDVTTKKLSSPTIKARAKSYLLAATVTFAVVQHAIRKATGYTEARRTTTAAESCVECAALDAIWLPIDEMPEVGTLICQNRCRCFVEYR